jgi:hypothetical protein
VKGAIAYYGAVGLFLFAAMALYASGLHANNVVVNNSINFSKGIPVGFPGDSFVRSFGYSVANTVIQSSRFKVLAAGNTYNIKPYSSFGYTWGKNITPTERIIFYSQNNLSYITAEVNVNTRKIVNISYTNTTNVHIYLTSSLVNQGGYSSKYCSSSFFTCLSTAPVYGAYGNVQVPSTISKPSGATAACCTFAQWTGVTNTTNTMLVQGGTLWSGFNLTASPKANSKGFVLFVEYVPSPTNGGSGPTFISPPSWMNGVQGQTINMTTKTTSNCVPSGGGTGDQWSEIWTIGSSSTMQGIQCVGTSTENYGWYVLESPQGCSGNSNGCYYGYYQLPDFSTVTYTSYICDNSNCAGIGTNYNPTSGYYIQHNSQDTSTSSISGGTTWTESWLSSN